MLQDKKEIGRRIRLIRTRLGLNQKEFGEKLGVATSSVSAYEKGETSPSFEVVAKIAKLGQTSIDVLLTGGSEDAPPHPDLYEWVKAEEEEKGIVPLLAGFGEKAPPTVSEILEAIKSLSSFAEFLEATPEHLVPPSVGNPSSSLTDEEQRLLDAYRRLDEKRRHRLVEDAEDMLLAMLNRVDHN